jgi:hypothetical protein
VVVIPRKNWIPASGKEVLIRFVSRVCTRPPAAAAAAYVWKFAVLKLLLLGREFGEFSNG